MRHSASANWNYPFILKLFNDQFYQYIVQNFELLASVGIYEKCCSTSCSIDISWPEELCYSIFLYHVITGNNSVEYGRKSHTSSNIRINWMPSSHLLMSTNWRVGDMAVILKLHTNFNSSYRLVALPIASKSLYCDDHRTLLMRSQHWLR